MRFRHRCHRDILLNAQLPFCHIREYWLDRTDKQSWFTHGYGPTQSLGLRPLLIVPSSGAFEGMPLVRTVRVGDLDIEAYAPRFASTFAIGSRLFPPVLPHHIVEHYFAGNASAALHRRMAWSAYVNRTGQVRTWYGCPTEKQLLDRIEIQLPPASLYDQQKPWAQFDWKLYVQEILRNQKREWLDPRIKYWISQGHTDCDPNYNHRERFQYRDWMFWNGSGLSHQPSQLATYHRSFWLNQGLTKETGPEVRPGGVGCVSNVQTPQLVIVTARKYKIDFSPRQESRSPRSFCGDEYSLEYRAQELLRIYESVRISWNTINQQTEPAHFDIIEEREARWNWHTHKYEYASMTPVVTLLSRNRISNRRRCLRTDASSAHASRRMRR